VSRPSWSVTPILCLAGGQDRQVLGRQPLSPARNGSNTPSVSPVSVLTSFSPSTSLTNVTVLVAFA